jgi:hypothetical protein
MKTYCSERVPLGRRHRGKFKLKDAFVWVNIKRHSKSEDVAFSGLFLVL